MKNIIWLILILFSIDAIAQKDVTKFLGIPVDGPKAVMIQKLKEKGFEYNVINDYLTGEFNGRDVCLSIATYKDKVRRIGLFNKTYYNEAEVKINFNNLVHQFSKNENYISFSNEQTIPDKEDISYGMNVESKRYEAHFYQKPDTNMLQKTIFDLLRAKYSKEELSDSTFFNKMPYSNDIDNIILEITRKKNVWFVISETSGQYLIYLMYDNEWNFADGEDL